MGGRGASGGSAAACLQQPAQQALPPPPTATLASSPYRARLRVGVGRPPAQVDPADWVLGRFPRADDARVEACVEWAAEATRLCCEQGALKAMNAVNRRREQAV